MIIDLQQREVVYKMLKDPAPAPQKLKEELKKLGYEGESAVGDFVLDQKGRTETHGHGGHKSHPSKEKEYLDFFEKHALAKAFEMMEKTKH